MKGVYIGRNSRQVVCGCVSQDFLEVCFCRGCDYEGVKGYSQGKLEVAKMKNISYRNWMQCMQQFDVPYLPKPSRMEVRKLRRQRKQQFQTSS